MNHHHGCHGGFSLDEKTRRSWYSPESVLADLREGMTFVDVGCGDGFFSILAAKKVGPKGRVYAVDIDASRVKMLQDKAEAEKLSNIAVSVGRAEDALFCKGCADIVFYSMDLHDFEDQVQVLANAKSMLRTTGKVIDLDWKKVKMEFGPPYDIRFSEKRVTEMMTAAGFTVKVNDAGPYHYLITGTPC
jgi:ubiquinone/menaquinone biosynthesis C-methylase UbiE